MGAVASQITSLTIVYSTVDSAADQRKYQRSASLAFVGGIHRGPVNSPAQMASNAENVSIWWRHHVWRGDLFFSFLSFIATDMAYVVMMFSYGNIRLPYLVKAMASDDVATQGDSTSAVITLTWTFGNIMASEWED